MFDIYGKRITPRGIQSNTSRQRSVLNRVKKKLPEEKDGLEKTGEFILGESKTDDGSGNTAQRFPNEIDDFLSSDERSF